MSNPLKAYVEGIHRELDYYPAWPPSAPHALGAVGRLENGQFQQLTTLSNLGIAFKEVRGPRGADLSLSSGQSVSVQIKAEGETLAGSSLPKAKAAAVVEFKSAGAFVFQALGPTVLWIDDKVGLSEQILNKFRSKNNAGKREWEEDWCVITEVVSTDSATILISTSNEGRLELSAEGMIPAGPVPLASVGGGLTVTKKVGEVLTYVMNQEKQTPLLRLMRVRRSFLQRILGGEDAAEVVRASLQGAGGLPRLLLEELQGDEMVPILDQHGKVTRDWILTPQPANPAKPEPKGKTKDDEEKSPRSGESESDPA
jgi:hypothetical protein